MSNFFYYSLLKITLLAVLTPSLIVTSINYFVHHLEADSFELPFSTLYVRKVSFLILINIDVKAFNPFLRIPFNWKNWHGYFAAFAFIYASLCGCVLCFIPGLCFVCGSTWLAESLANDIANDVNDFHRLNKKASKIRGKAKSNLLARFRTIIQDFSNIQELSKMFSFSINNLY